LSPRSRRPRLVDVVCLLDSSGAIRHIGEDAEPVFQRSRAALLGRPLVEFFPESVLPKLLPYLSVCGIGRSHAAGNNVPDTLSAYAKAIHSNDGSLPPPSTELILEIPPTDAESQLLTVTFEGSVSSVLPLVYIFRLRWAPLPAADAVVQPQETAPSEAHAILREQIRHLLDGIDAVLFQMDESGHLRYLNQAWLNFSGFSPAESRDKSFLEFLDHDDTPAFIEEFEQLLLGQRDSMRMDLRLLCANGSVTWCEFQARVDASIPRDHGLVLYGTLSDISARRLIKDEREHYISVLQGSREQAEKQASSLTHLAQQLMAARDEAVKAIEARTQFLANMSHEIRTPMNGMVGMLSLLLETELQKDQREYAEIARNSGMALMEILTEILDYSKIESRTLQLEVERFNLYQLLDELVESYAERVELKNIEIILHFDSEVPRSVVGDIHRLRQVMNHLLANALKFTSEGQIQVFVASIEADDNRTKLHFEVSDTGLGIPADRQPHIFKPFYQVDESNSRKFGGTGLGLAICQELVSLMGGQMGVSSEPGEGATFWFTADFGAPPEDRSDDDDYSKIQGRSIFVYAGSQYLRTALCRQLASWGMNVQTPNDPSETVRALLRKPATGPSVRVLIAEAESLVAGAETTVASLNRLTSNVEIRLILLTPYHRNAYRAALKDLMVSDLLTKPLRSNRLQTAVLKAIREYAPNLPLEESIEAAQLSRTPTESELDSRGRILISQTDWVHQRLTIYLLSSLGYRAEIASTEDYCESLMRSRRYSVLLLDTENPKFDSISFVKRLRKQESGKLHRTAVIALVRNMTAKVQDTMRDAGVDEVVPLPLQRVLLKDVLARHCVPEPEGIANLIPGPPMSHPPSAEPSLDPKVIATFEKLTEGSELDIYSHMIWPALDDVRDRLKLIAGALDQNDVGMVRNEAHTIKGSSGYIGATKIQKLSADLEKAAKENRLDKSIAEEQVADMNADLDRIIQALQQEGHERPA